MSDPELGFKELDPEKYAGWLVSKGNARIAETSDNYFLRLALETKIKCYLSIKAKNISR